MRCRNLGSSAAGATDTAITEDVWCIKSAIMVIAQSATPASHILHARSSSGGALNTARCATGYLSCATKQDWVVTDVRFQNEAGLVQELGGQIGQEKSTDQKLDVSV